MGREYAYENSVLISSSDGVTWTECGINTIDYGVSGIAYNNDDIVM